MIYWKQDDNDWNKDKCEDSDEGHRERIGNGAASVKLTPAGVSVNNAALEVIC
jgi:hypothetical protein